MATAQTSTHVCGPLLSYDPASLMNAEFKKETYKGFTVSRKDPLYIGTVDGKKVAVQVYDKKKPLIANEAKSLVKFFISVKYIFTKGQDTTAVVVLSAAAKMCSKTDTSERARPMLASAEISVYRSN
jgi:hypothetical protein